MISQLDVCLRHVMWIRIQSRQQNTKSYAQSH